jgi:alpha-N-acetylglucosaminidase
LVWYDQSDWEQFIDWLALTGINLMLALTGQEEIQYQVFREFGLQDQDIRSWFNGPALLTWSRGQNEYGSNICGPLPRSWMRDQYNLQRNHILPRLRSLGIVGQLPGFQGNVPIQFKDIYQDANMTKEGGTAWMDSLDPLYAKIADVWMKKLIEAFGTDHWYQLDGYFNGATAPWMLSKDERVRKAGGISSPLDSSSHDEAWFQRGTAAYQGLARTDPEAVWSFQGFSFIGWDKPEQAEALKGFIDAVPKDQFVIIDMAYTGLGEWQKWGNASYYGTPFVWTALHDFGGTDGIKGDLRRINQIPSALINQPTSAIGLGGTPEGIDQNPAYYDFLFEANWREGPVEDLSRYMGERKERQYGIQSSRVRAAWKLLMNSLYADERSVQDTTGVAHLEPRATLFENDGFTPTPMMCQVHQAWEQLLLSGTQELVDTNEPFRYDLVNLGREVLAQLSSPMAHNFSAATKQDPIDAAVLNETGQLFIELLRDIDTLVATDSAFLLGPWIESAREWGINAENDCYSLELNSTNCAHFYEWNARTQITTWNPTRADDAKIPGGPIDYAAKHWSGLIEDYYAVRATLLLDQGMEDQMANQPLNQTAVDRLFAQHAYQWTTATNPYPTHPEGDALTTSYDLFFKYLHWFQACDDEPDVETPFPKEEAALA